jgi:hypothetical protein
MGLCYFFTSNKNTALEYFLSSNPGISDYYDLYVGRSYQYSGDFKKAEEHYEKYYDSLSKHKKKKSKDFIERLKKDCETGEILKKNPVAVSIVNLGPVINSAYDDYNAMISPDDSTMFFTSRRPVSVYQKKKINKRLKENILKADNNAVDFPASRVMLVKILSSNVTVNNDLVGFDPADPERFYYYDGKKRSGGINIAIKKDSIWHRKKIKKIDHIASRETSTSFDGAGNAYFISNRNNGYGGKDIWMAKRKGRHAFHKPVNLGGVINTSEDEEAVYVSPDGKTIYFSSKGHGGLGGYDVFRSEKNIDGNWSPPENLGYPINGPADELFYRPTQDSLVSIYTTIRSDSYGGYDIYKILKGSSISFVLSGVIIDEKSLKPIPASISVFDFKNNTLLNTIYNDPVTGRYILKIERAGEYVIQIDSKGYSSKTLSYQFKEGIDKTEVTNFKLKRAY